MNGLNYYDFHARWMDNTVPGFISPDPLAENHYYESPYAYCGGNPVSRTDPRGLDWYWNKSSDIPTWFEGNKKQNGFQHHKSSLSRRFGMTVVLFKEDGSQEALLPEFDVTPYFSQVNYPLFYGMNNNTQEVFKTEDKDESYEHALQGGAYMKYDAEYVNSTRTQGSLIWYNSDGSEAARYRATSGSGNPKYFTLPPGKYSASNFRITSDPMFMRNGIGFKVTLGPSRVWDNEKGAYREALLIHPARLYGTQGCIGLIGDYNQISDFQFRISNYLQINNSMNIIVEY
jgi:hypothetical protein